MPGEIPYIRRHDDLPFNFRVAPCAPNSEHKSGLGCRVENTDDGTAKNPASGWVF
jgi:hypothetical protein